MQVIPVIDLKGGLAVHAVKGQRENYRPLTSRLCASPAPLAVLEGLLRTHAFRTVYLADLDALTGRGENRAIIHELLHAFPAVSFWVDQGWPDPAELLPNQVPVFGSETLDEGRLPLLQTWRDKGVLSLDFFGERFVGPPALAESPQFWPQDVILMTLGRVGSAAGPDRSRLHRCIRLHRRHNWYAAGGVRNATDLLQLKHLGARGALVATALHDGSLGADDLAALA